MLIVLKESAFVCVRIDMNETWGRFHQHFISIFYAQRSLKHKKKLFTWLSFCDFGIFAHKSWLQIVGEIDQWSGNFF